MSSGVWGRIGVVVVLGLLAQVAVLDDITVVGAHPDVMVILAAGAGLLAGAARGAMIGFVVGCLADLVVDTPFGLSPLVFVLVGFACGMLASSGEHRTRSAEVAVLLTAAAAGTLAFAVLGALVGQPGMFDSASIAAIVVVLCGAVVLSAPVLGALRWALSASSRSRSVLVVPSGGSAAG